MASNYNDSHRAFVQAFMSRNVMTADDAKGILAAILTVHEGRQVAPHDVSNADLNNHITIVNKALSRFDYEIRTAIHQITNERYCALVNSSSDPLTQLATTYTPDEISFIKRVLDAMFETNNTTRREAMAVSSINISNLAKVSAEDRRESLSQNAGSVQSLTMAAAETVTQNLVEQGWLEQAREGIYTLGPRGLLELRDWLIATYNDEEDEEAGRHLKIKKCLGCKDIVTMGQRCSNRQCPARLHDRCTTNFFRAHRSQTCPSCHAEWTGESLVGPQAME